MHVSVYNGLPSTCELIDIRFINEKFEADEGLIELSKLEDDEFYYEMNVAKNDMEYNIQTFFVKCGGKTITFPGPGPFGPNPNNPYFNYEEDILDLEDDKERLPGISILLTYDHSQWNSQDKIDGIVFYGNNIAPQLKTPDGYQDVK